MKCYTVKLILPLFCQIRLPELGLARLTVGQIKLRLVTVCLPWHKIYINKRLPQLSGLALPSQSHTALKHVETLV